MDKLRQIQLCELDILKELDRVCRENNIPYSLAYGTMLGAVRHKGFIPWDDDLDIYMRYEDTQKLYGKLSNDYFYQTEKTDPQIPFIFYKIRKNGTLMEEESHKNLKMHKGIWIDIFPYVNSSSTEFGKKMQFNLSMILQHLRCKYLNKFEDTSHLAHFYIKSSAIIEKIVLNFIILLGSNKSSEYLVFANDPYKIRFFKKSFFDNKSEYNFEDSYFYGIAEYDDYLKQRYGNDYMTPKKYAHLNSFYDVIV